MTWNDPLTRRPAAGDFDPVREISRMRSGHLPTRLLLLAAVLASVTGCSRDSYDEQMVYPVRTDLLVSLTAPWGDLTPPAFNRPGVLPLDALRWPEKEWPDGSAKLHGLIGKTLFDPTTFSAEVRAEYAKNLGEMFGTPAHPKVTGFNADALKGADGSPTAEAILQTLKLDDATLAEGSKHYRMHCLHCHGLEGNGRGPTGPWVNPPPRDYRSGLFKYTSSNQAQSTRKPRRDDILHILAFGIEGTSMPSFNILSIEEREQLASYVIHLSLRGDVEARTMTDQLTLMTQSKGGVGPKFTLPIREDLKDPTMRQAMEDNQAYVIGMWMTAQKPESLITPGPYKTGASEADFLTSAARGGKIFYQSCIQCHQNFGRESNLVYDSWGTIVRGRNVYEGIYRGGRRPIDLYNRIHGGIVGAGMTGYNQLKDGMTAATAGVPEADWATYDPLWDIVNFLRAVPYRDMRDKLRGDPYKINLPD
jgi:mono/diheme cytochrome c family protein